MLARFAAAVSLALVVAAALPLGAAARCAMIPLPAEVRQSAYVFEGTLESVAELALTFRVTAVWSGTPPARVTVTSSRRRPFASPSDVGTAYLVLASGAEPRLSISRCGSSSPLASAAATQQALRALGLTRVAR